MSRRPQPHAAQPQVQAEALDPLISTIMPPVPAPAVGLTRQGLARYAVGDYRAAEQAFRAVAEVAGHEPMAWNNLALVLVALGELDQAAAALRRSLNLDAGQFAPWMNLASALLRQGKADEAEAACAAALALDPASADAWQVAALARLSREDFTGAAEAFTRTLDLAGESAELRLNLGAALLRCGRFEAAAASLAAAVALDPTSFVALEVKQACDFIVAAIDGDMARAVAAYPPGLLATPAEADRVFKTALLYLDWAGERAAAGRVAQAWASRRPDNIEAIHLRDAALAHVTPRQPAELVAKSFDDMADDFDDRLVRRLAYQGPERLAALIAQAAQAEGALDVLDLGCGTGLCASFLRPYARLLSGVDLSAGMLAKAAARGLYDHLEAADLLTVLAQAQGGWDLLAAADTFPYLGDLGAVFEGAGRALRQGGLFAFSTEAADGESYRLKGNGRYAHADRYIERLADGRFEIAARTAATLRREAASPVEGGFYLLRKI
ncbi:tetratricopeptide repeat protein [Phenylobacterium sp.]|uniref:tetratricopeptide repeat protein n=1 Tax=Phenylobacterium sp. TaxID=1871053 RepID=UPI002BB1E599|nr:tetratricopeptide repeat protein [Phenylobacterium sp.]HLZ76277.1 tetratricopeptide repeat protein [Phenylobacterium sp.]